MHLTSSWMLDILPAKYHCPFSHFTPTASLKSDSLIWPWLLLPSRPLALDAVTDANWWPVSHSKIFRSSFISLWQQIDISNSVCPKPCPHFPFQTLIPHDLSTSVDDRHFKISCQLLIYAAKLTLPVNQGKTLEVFFDISLIPSRNIQFIRIKESVDSNMNIYLDKW